jgi:hypothetical protein
MSTRPLLVAEILVVAAAVTTSVPSFVLASPSNMAIMILDAQDESPTLPPWIGEQTLHLWNIPAIFPPSIGTEFAFSTVNLTIVDLIPRPGVINLGTPQSPILVFSECTEAAVIADLIVLDESGAGGRICFRPSDQSGMNCSTGCFDHALYSNLYYGFASDGTEPCQGWDANANCYPVVSVEAQTWGMLRILYR